MGTIFTFHNVSINTRVCCVCVVFNWVFTFHNVSINTRGTQHLCRCIGIFTFHNVSINTNLKPYSILPGPYLHSTMFLLILEMGVMELQTPIFTFHNVSINTRCSKRKRIRNPNLHSTMFLLIRHLCCAPFWFVIIYIPQCFY